MTEELIKTLLYQSEGDTLDFKRDQYPFTGADDSTKSELVKDILSFANAWKTSDAHILIGVEENPGGKANAVGITDHLDDANLQQLVNTKTNRRVHFRYSAITVEGQKVGVITVDRDQDRPVFLKKNYGKLSKNVVYVRRGSSTAEADPNEIAEMGKAKAEASLAQPSLTLEFADPKAHRSLGACFEETSVILVDPPPPPVNPLTKAEVVEAYKKYTNVLESFRSGGFLNQMANPMRGFEPKPEDVRLYHEEISRLRSAAIVIKNTGDVTARDIRVEIVGPKQEGFEVRDERDAPQKPTGSLGFQMPPINSSISVTIHDHQWCAVVEVGMLQPKAEYWTDPELYFGATSPATVQATARIYADKLAQPIVVPLEIKLRTLEQVYRLGN